MSGVSGEFLFYTLTNGHAINWADRPPLADRLYLANEKWLFRTLCEKVRKKQVKFVRY